MCFLLDSLTGLCFLINTGRPTYRSLLPKSIVHSGCGPGTDTHLIAANGSRIITYGYKSVRLFFSDNTFTWQFIVADVSILLIGADFLAHFHLLVDVANCHLIDTSTLASTTVTAAPPGLALQINDAQDDLASLSSSFPAVFRPELHLAPRTPANHFIRTSGPPMHSGFRRLAPEKLTTAKKVFPNV